VPHPPAIGTAALLGDRFTEADGLGCTAAGDDEHAAIASQPMSAMQRCIFNSYYTGATIRFRT